MSPILGNELLRGELVYLNAISREDLPAMAKGWTDIGYVRHLSRRQAVLRSPDSLEEWYKHMYDDNAEPVFAIRTLADDRMIGMCAFSHLRWQSRHSMFWIGIFDPAMRGHGYGTDAVRVLLRYAFLELNLNCVALDVFSYNEPALATYRKVGFTLDGTLRAYLYRDGHYYDMHTMSMLRSEWETRYHQVAES